MRTTRGLAGSLLCGYVEGCVGQDDVDRHPFQGGVILCRQRIARSQQVVQFKTFSAVHLDLGVVYSALFEIGSRISRDGGERECQREGQPESFDWACSCARYGPS